MHCSRGDQDHLSSRIRDKGSVCQSNGSAQRTGLALLERAAGFITWHHIIHCLPDQACLDSTQHQHLGAPRAGQDQALQWAKAVSKRHESDVHAFCRQQKPCGGWTVHGEQWGGLGHLCSAMTGKCQVKTHSGVFACETLLCVHEASFRS